MWAMNNDIKIHWPYFIAHHMLRFTKSDHSKAQQHVINTRALNHMGRNIQREEEEQAPPPQAQEQQEAQAGPFEQPSMRDMMQVLLRIEQNQANMDTHLTRVDQRLSRIEQYLEINEDEDQD
ncbi:hypothetical protein PIB30_107209 [Stylosanthes scabra]|uniref:Uncharacterized protein n=1 Tax=Stylosanthes scabra TaxID=79078 RepID=A0ABU6ZXR4_9FABA|nr:hypothetical protein [Stylosanthes scabra]